MIPGLLALGVAMLLFSRLECRARPTARLEPARTAHLATCGLVLGWLVVELTLVLAATPALATMFGAASFAGFCEHAVGRILPGGVVTSWVAGALAVLVALRTVDGLAAACVAARRVRAEPWLGEHHDHGEYELVVLPTDSTLAVGVPGRPPQVLLSEGLLARLDRRGRDLVIAHELAHLRLGHRRTLMVTAAVERALGWVPCVRVAARRIGELLEHAADDEVAGRSPARRSVLLRTLKIAALARASGADPGPLHSVRVRLEHLARVPGRRTTRLGVVGPYVPLLVGGLLALGLLGGWVMETEHAAALGADC